MAANGITLKPVRMGDIVSQSPAPVPVTAVRGRYTPPSKRTATVEPVANIDLSDKNFPTFGSIPVKVPIWGKHVVQKIAPVAEVIPVKESEPGKETLCDKIKEKIRLDAIADEECLREPETDPWKMTDTELENSGWAKLKLSSARDICLRGFSLKEAELEQDWCVTMPPSMRYDHIVEIKDCIDYESE